MVITLDVEIRILYILPDLRKLQAIFKVAKYIRNRSCCTGKMPLLSHMFHPLSLNILSLSNNLVMKRHNSTVDTVANVLFFHPFL